MTLFFILGSNVHAQTGTGDTALTYACENGHTDVAEVLLVHGAELVSFTVSFNQLIISIFDLWRIDCFFQLFKSWMWKSLMFLIVYLFSKQINVSPLLCHIYCRVAQAYHHWHGILGPIPTSIVDVSRQLSKAGGVLLVSLIHLTCRSSLKKSGNQDIHADEKLLKVTTNTNNTNQGGCEQNIIVCKLISGLLFVKKKRKRKNGDVCDFHLA